MLTKYLFFPCLLLSCASSGNNQVPVVYAGEDQFISIQSPSAILEGSATDADGKIVSYAWEKVSGPEGVTLSAATGAQTEVRFREAGTYLFRLTAQDNQGGRSADDVQVEVGEHPWVPLRFTSLPDNQPDLPRPGFGLEYWIYQHLVRIPAATAPDNQETNRYSRFEWAALEKEKDRFDFAAFDASIQQAIDRRQTFSFGVMVYCAGCDDFKQRVDDGWLRSYPLWLYQEMKREEGNTPFLSPTDGGNWVPNWNATRLWQRYEALLKALGKHIATAQYKGVPYRHVVRNIDLRGVGNFGEWHFYQHRDDMPPGAIPTAAVGKNIIDMYIRAFPDHQLMVSFDIFAAKGSGSWSEFPAEVGYHALTQQNRKGPIGWRRDSWGDNEKFISDRLERNPHQFNGKALGPLIMDRWKTAPVGGEILECCTENDGDGEDAITGEGPYWDLLRQGEFYHISTLGNGNHGKYRSYVNQYLPADTDPQFQERMREASRRMGARLTLQSGQMTDSLVPGQSFRIALAWRNDGVTPCYDDWRAVFELRESASNRVVWRDSSAFVFRRWLPGMQQHTDTFRVPGQLPSGSYTLYLHLADPNGYQRHMPLFIAGGEAGPSGPTYRLRENISAARR